MTGKGAANVAGNQSRRFATMTDAVQLRILHTLLANLHDAGDLRAGAPFGLSLLMPSGIEWKELASLITRNEQLKQTPNDMETAFNDWLNSEGKQYKAIVNALKQGRIPNGSGRQYSEVKKRVKLALDGLAVQYFLPPRQTLSRRKWPGVSQSELYSLSLKFVRAVQSPAEDGSPGALSWDGSAIRAVVAADFAFKWCVSCSSDETVTLWRLLAVYVTLTDTSVEKLLEAANGSESRGHEHEDTPFGPPERRHADHLRLNGFIAEIGSMSPSDRERLLGLANGSAHFPPPAHGQANDSISNTLPCLLLADGNATFNHTILIVAEVPPAFQVVFLEPELAPLTDACLAGAPVLVSNGVRAAPDELPRHTRKLRFSKRPQRPRTLDLPGPGFERPSEDELSRSVLVAAAPAPLAILPALVTTVPGAVAEVTAQVVTAAAPLALVPAPVVAVSAPVAPDTTVPSTFASVTPLAAPVTPGHTHHALPARSTHRRSSRTDTRNPRSALPRLLYWLNAEESWLADRKPGRIGSGRSTLDKFDRVHALIQSDWESLKLRPFVNIAKEFGLSVSTVNRETAYERLVRPFNRKLNAIRRAH
jgi:hypothetical protein